MVVAVVGPPPRHHEDGIEDEIALPAGAEQDHRPWRQRQQTGVRRLLTDAVAKTVAEDARVTIGVPIESLPGANPRPKQELGMTRTRPRVEPADRFRLAFPFAPKVEVGPRGLVIKSSQELSTLDDECPPVLARVPRLPAVGLGPVLDAGMEELDEADGFGGESSALLRHWRDYNLYAETIGCPRKVRLQARWIRNAVFGVVHETD